jgi:2-keto-3-deoxy-L-rhamnonate aldolase RhmA
MADGFAGQVRAGRPLIGTVLTLAGAATAELLAEPFDLVWLDLEHGALGPRDAQDMLIGAQSTGAFGLVRLPADAFALMTAVLDAGADGLVLADVGSADVARTAIERATYPPNGSRGWGPRRLSLRGRAHRAGPVEPSIWVQIESTEGLANIEEIVSVPGVDAVVVGTADLSFALGVPLDPHAGALLAAVDTVRQACASAEVGFGLAGALTVAPPTLLAGASILVHSTDARLSAEGVDHAAGWLRDVLQPKPNGVIR